MRTLYVKSQDKVNDSELHKNTKTYCEVLQSDGSLFVSEHTATSTAVWFLYTKDIHGNRCRIAKYTHKAIVDYYVMLFKMFYVNHNSELDYVDMVDDTDKYAEKLLNEIK